MNYETHLKDFQFSINWKIPESSSEDLSCTCVITVLEEQPQHWMDEKLFSLSTWKDVESEPNETLFSSGLGLVRSLSSFLVSVWFERDCVASLGCLSWDFATSFLLQRFVRIVFCSVPGLGLASPCASCHMSGWFVSSVMVHVLEYEGLEFVIVSTVYTFLVSGV